VLSLQALQKALVAWRAEAAAAGCLPVLSSLSQDEVARLSAGQAEAVGRLVMQLEAQGRLLLRQAAAGQLDLAGCSADVAAALAWKLHTGGPQAAEDLVELVMVQVRCVWVNSPPWVTQGGAWGQLSWEAFGDDHAGCHEVAALL
jgi:hypothetical protein